MIKSIILTGILSICLLGNLDWKEFKSYEGKFIISVPGEMTEKVITTETSLGNIEYHTFFYQPKEKDADNVIYMLSYCDYPEHSIHSDSTELIGEFFDATVEEAVRSVRGTKMYSDKISLTEKAYPGMIWRIVYNEETAVIKTKAFLVGNRFYTLQTVTLKEKSLNPSIDRYLDSFDVMD